MTFRFFTAGVDFGKFYGSEFVHAFVKAILVIIVSELGDKTFFIAAIFAMKHPRMTVFLGAIGALGLMTFLSGKNCTLHIVMDG